MKWSATTLSVAVATLAALLSGGNAAQGGKHISSARDVLAAVGKSSARLARSHRGHVGLFSQQNLSLILENMISDGDASLSIANLNLDRLDVLREIERELVPLIKHAAWLSAEADYGYSTLHRIAVAGRVDMAVLYLSGVDDVAAAVNDRSNSTGETPMHIAARYGYTDLLALFVDQGGDVNLKADFVPTLSTFGKGETPLMLAAEGGHEPTVDYLVDLDGIDLDAQVDDGGTALHRAIENGRYAIGKRLIEKGANVNLVGGRGDTYAQRWTPITAAAAAGAKGMVDYMLANGADPNIGANSSNFASSPPIVVAAAAGYTGVVDSLIAAGVDIDTRGRYKFTSVMVAAKKGNELMVVHLIDKGADINVHFFGDDKWTWTAIRLAMEYGHVRVAEILFAAGAKLSPHDLVRFKEIVGEKAA